MSINVGYQKGWSDLPRFILGIKAEQGIPVIASTRARGEGHPANTIAYIESYSEIGRAEEGRLVDGAMGTIDRLVAATWDETRHNLSLSCSEGKSNTRCEGRVP